MHPVSLLQDEPEIIGHAVMTYVRFPLSPRKRRVDGIRSSRWQLTLADTVVKLNGERHALWRAVDHEDDMLETFGTKTRDKTAA